MKRPTPGIDLPVYVPLAPDPRGRYDELRFSLRSLARFGSGVGYLAVVGPEVPGWMDAGADHLPFPARRGETSSFAHVRRKIEWICSGTWAPPWWILWNDDFFASIPFRVEEVGVPAQPCFAHRLSKHEHRDGSTPFVRMLRATAAWIEANGDRPEEALDFLVHRPLLVHSRTMLEALSAIPPEVSPRAAYGRAALAAGIGPLRLAPDAKHRTPPRDGAPEASGGFWSSDDAFSSVRGRAVLAELYPERSRWEREEAGS